MPFGDPSGHPVLHRVNVVADKNEILDLSGYNLKADELVGVQNGIVLDNLASLRNLNKTAGRSAFVVGYYESGDGGGGVYWCDAADTTTADDGGAVIVSADGGRWKLQTGKVSVRQFGAKGDGVTNDRVAIQAAFDYITAQGGGELVFPKGNYHVTGTHPSSPLSVHQVQADLSVAAEKLDVQLLCRGMHDAHIAFDGATISSGKTNGGATWVLDGCNNLQIVAPKMVGKTNLSADGTTVNVTGTGAITILSQTANSSSIDIADFSSATHYSGVVATGNPTSSYRAKHITLSGYANIRDGYYGVCCQNNGDFVTVENAYTWKLNRPFFIYGCEGFAGNVIGDEMRGGFQAIVKAYSRDTKNIRLNFTVANRRNTQSRLQFASQHNPARQATPATVKTVYLRYVESNSIAGTSVSFDYYRNGVAQARADGADLFDNFIIEGDATGDVTSGVTLATAHPCHVHMSRLRAANGFGLLDGTGFVGSKRLTYAPALTFGGGASGLTYSTRQGSYYVVDGICHVLIRMTLSAKGASTGSASISLPLAAHEFELSPAIGVALGWANMAGLSGNIIPLIGAPRGTGVTLVNQTATGQTTLSNTNFTDTSDISIQLAYPI
jgi:hypothetical protein